MVELDTGKVLFRAASPDTLPYQSFAWHPDSQGVKQGTEFRVNTSTTGQQIEPSVAMDADGDCSTKVSPMAAHAGRRKNGRTSQPVSVSWVAPILAMPERLNDS